jgi:SAM-dependent methyltransferase
VLSRFYRQDLKARYDVSSFDEDDWHDYAGKKTLEVLKRCLMKEFGTGEWLLNAGSGVYKLDIAGWLEVSIDFFFKPLKGRSSSICGDIHRLPFRSNTFGAVVCVGEVLGYCDPAQVINEFSRVLKPSGKLIIDFSTSRSFRFWLKPNYGRAANLITDSYNGSKERLWVYDTKYIEMLLRSHGFEVVQKTGIHTWSSIARRFGASPRAAVGFQRMLDSIALPNGVAELMTIEALRS